MVNCWQHSLTDPGLITKEKFTNTFVCNNFSSVRNIAQKDNIVVNGIVYKKKVLQPTCRHLLATEFFSACSDASKLFKCNIHLLPLSTPSNTCFGKLFYYTVCLFLRFPYKFVLLVILLFRGTCKCHKIMVLPVHDIMGLIKTAAN